MANWTEANVIKEGLKYSTKMEFRKKSGGAYAAAHKNGWMKLFTHFEVLQKPRGHWTKARVMAEGRKYSTQKEFIKNSSSAYNAAYRNNWFNEFTHFEKLLKPQGHWKIKDNVMAEGVKYSTKMEFKENSPGAYNAAVAFNWLIEFTHFQELLKPKGFYSKEMVLLEASKYFNDKEFREGSSAFYSAAQRNGWMKEILHFKRLQIPNGFWSIDKVLEEGRKYKTIKDFRKGSSGAYSAAYRNDWMEFFTHFKRFGHKNKRCI